MRDITETLAHSESENRLARQFETISADGAEQWPPFHWQLRLLRRLLDNDLPSVVDVPTGLGKTSIMALWLIALAEGANLPRRLIYVVDRRAVVDQATRFAKRIKDNLPPEVAGRLGLGSAGLPISTLRGGFADNREWLQDPSRPAVIVGTIDMIGSRLLFEGYGVSRRMRPYHAGLLGVDSLVLLDEAHLCPPFEALLRQVEMHRDSQLGPKDVMHWSPPPFRLMSLSATGRELASVPSSSFFRLKQQDCEEPEVRKRLNAQKRLKLTELNGAQSLTEQMASRAVELGDGSETPSRVLVFCNSRKDALDVKRRIDKECRRKRKSGERTSGFNSELLVGERRVHERTQLEQWLDQHGFLGGIKSPTEAPVFLVATSAGEVGVDLDADHMVGDLVAYERMVQRLGRVNRRGGDARTAMIDVFFTIPALKTNASKAAKDKHNAIVDKIRKHRAPLLLLPSFGDGRQNASVSAIVELKSNCSEVVSAATTPAPLFPALNRPLLDAWSMTSLKQHEGRPEVAPWLRGWENVEESQTVVVWRKYLPIQHGGNDESSVSPTTAIDYFRKVPLHATEKLEAVSTHVFDWLLKRTARLTRSAKDPHIVFAPGEIVAVVVNSAGDYVKDVKFRELRELAAPAKGLTKPKLARRKRLHLEWGERLLPGAMLVLDARIGGLLDGMLDEKHSAEATTADEDEKWRQQAEDSSSDSFRPLIKFRVEEVEEDRLRMPQEVEGWRHVGSFETHFDSDGAVRRGLAVLKWHDDTDDQDSLSILSEPQLLHEHAKQVSDHARRIGERLELAQELIDALTIAARLHDDGKAVPRWQRAMNAPKDHKGRPFAKTKGGGNWRILEGYRHEFGSLIKAEGEIMPDGTRDLILHLIAAHHGNARPYISPAGCEEGPPSQLEAKAGNAALRFATLQRQYGPWGLAWLEALVRAADQAASREWSQQHSGDQHG